MNKIQALVKHYKDNKYISIYLNKETKKYLIEFEYLPKFGDIQRELVNTELTLEELKILKFLLEEVINEKEETKT